MTPSIRSSRRVVRRKKRCGTTIVEVAFTLPIFLIFIFGVVEFGRLQMVSNLLSSACRTAARQGALEGISTEAVRERVEQVMRAVIDVSNLTIIVKSADAHDQGGPSPTTATQYSAMPNVELLEASPSELFLVRASVEYSDISFVPFSILYGAVLTGHTYMRHE